MAISDKFVPQITDGSAGPAPHRYQIISTDDAIDIADGVVIITKGTAAAITIDNPPTTMPACVLHIVSTTAAAHTVDYTGGFGGGGTGVDRATFSAAVNKGMTLIGYNGVWHVQGLNGVTLG